MATNRTKNLRLNGINPLSYVGVNPYTPPGFNIQDRDPTADDNKGFLLGDLWLNTQQNPPNPPVITDLWILVALGPNGATWRQFGGGGAGNLDTLTGNSGGVVGPDGLANIDVIGNNAVGLTVVGNPGANTLTITTTSGTSLVDSLTGNVGGAVPADALQNINVVGDVISGLSVSGNPGTNTLTITTTSTNPLLETLTGDAGGAVPADAAHNINIVGGPNVTVTGNAGTNTLQIDVGSASLLDTLTGNTGGAVGPDGGGNINVLGDTTVGLTVAGNAGTNTLLVTTDSGNPFVETLTGDTGGAVNADVNNNINVIGGTNITVAGNPGTNTLTINASGGAGDVDTLTGNTGGPVGVDGAANINVIGDLADGITVSGNAGTNTLTIQSSTGNIFLQTLTGDTGGPVPGDINANIDIVGTLNNISVTGNAGANTLTVNTGGSVATTYVTNAGNAIPAGGVLNVLGTGGITTAGAGNTISINGGGGGGGAGQFAFLATQTTDSAAVLTVVNPIQLGAATGALTEIFDVGGNFTPGGGIPGSPATFTAPITGRYQMTVYVGLNDPNITITYTSFYTIVLVTNARSYSAMTDYFKENNNTTRFFTQSISVVADMTAGDTATVLVTVDPAIASSYSIVGDPTGVLTWWSGYFVS